MSAQSVRWLIACKNGIRSKPNNFAPTQREPATWGTQVRGLLTKTVAISTGKFKRKYTPSKAHAIRCTGNGVGGIKAIKRPSANERDTLPRLKVQQRRSSMTAVKCLKHQCFSSVLRSGVTRLSQRFMVFVFTPPERPLCRFRDACTRLRDHLGNQWLVAGAKSTV